MTALVVLTLLWGGRDPFTGEKPAQPPDAEDPCEEELCRHALTDLTLVAIISGDASPVAMFEDPRRKGHVVRRGTRIGTRGGRVTAISRECVTVVEHKRPTDICINREARRQAQPPLQ